MVDMTRARFKLADLDRGWVVRVDNAKMGTRSWWYGPDHGFGTTSGPLDSSVCVFATRTAAVDALRSVYGRPASEKFTPRRVADATRDSLADRRRSRDTWAANPNPDRYTDQYCAEIVASIDADIAELEQALEGS